MATPHGSLLLGYKACQQSIQYAVARQEIHISKHDKFDRGFKTKPSQPELKMNTSHKASTGTLLAGECVLFSLFGRRPASV